MRVAFEVDVVDGKAMANGNQNQGKQTELVSMLYYLFSSSLMLWTCKLEG
jgi:hypothetical protein